MVAVVVVITELPPLPFSLAGYTIPYHLLAQMKCTVDALCLVPFRTCTPLVYRPSWMGVTRCPETTGR